MKKLIITMSDEEAHDTFWPEYFRYLSEIHGWKLEEKDVE